MLVGEIGIPRLEYLYDLRYWEILLITRGYFRRHHPGWEQVRLIAYNAHYCMGSKDPVPLVDEWIKFPWEKEPAPPITDKERDELQAEMDAINKAAEKF
jgi:hypothetical protein